MIAYRLVSPPLSSPLLDVQLLSPQPAMYAALAGAVAMAGGGLLALTADRSSAKQQPPPEWKSSDQVSV